MTPGQHCQWQPFHRLRSRSGLYCSVVSLLIVNLLLCRIYKWNCMVGTCVQEETAHSGSGTTRGVRHPLRVLQRIPCRHQRMTTSLAVFSSPGVVFSKNEWMSRWISPAIQHVSLVTLLCFLHRHRHQTRGLHWAAPLAPLGLFSKCWIPLSFRPFAKMTLEHCKQWKVFLAPFSLSKETLRYKLHRR